ncbi:MAG: NAD(P)/FAD-dependent oxidoreductase, partial [Spirochaetota bacterium]
MKTVILDNILLDPFSVHGKGESSALCDYLSHKYSIPFENITIVKRSVDARKKDRVVWRYRVRCMVAEKDLALIGGEGTVEEESGFCAAPEQIQRPMSVVVVGSGPAGLFGALWLSERGADVTLIERGKCVEERASDIRRLEKEGILDQESNVLFGEGGAGTYSDGKLTTRIHKPHIEWFFSQMVRFGAGDSILYDAKPHVGTDVLSRVVGNIRKELVRRGSSVIFSEKMTELMTEGEKVSGIRCASGKEYRADAVLCAIGHSARDTYEALCAQGVCLEKKGSAVGMRIEHPAEFINSAQYGRFAAVLPAADYRLVWNDPVTKRGVYSFCMCPGGEVVNSSSQDGMLCVNGMSYSRRDLPFSNAAIVTSIHPGDIPGGPLDMIRFQQMIEAKAYQMGGGAFRSPVQKAASFIAGRDGAQPKQISYRNGGNAARLDQLYPDWITEPLKKGLSHFDRMIKGFCAEGVLIGAETRTSSPVRIVRNAAMQSVSTKGLFP